MFIISVALVVLLSEFVCASVLVLKVFANSREFYWTLIIRLALYCDPSIFLRKAMRKVKAFVPLGNPQFKITTAYYEPNKRARKPWAIKRRPKNHFCAYCWKIVNCVGAVCDGVPLSGGERSCFIATQGDLWGTKGFFWHACP